MYLLTKFRDHRSYSNGEINFYIKSYMVTLGNAELTTSICHIGRFFKSRIQIYNPEVPGIAGRNTRRRRIQAIAKRFAFHPNVKSSTKLIPFHWESTSPHLTVYYWKIGEIKVKMKQLKSNRNYIEIKKYKETDENYAEALAAIL